MFERIEIITLVGLLYFSKTLTYQYSSDDIPAAQRQKDPVKWRQWLWILEGRARSWSQLDHFITTVIHILTCVCIYLAFGANDASFLASFLFMFNPINNQVSVWVAGRGYGIAALGMTGALAFPKIGLLFLLAATYYNAGFFAPLVFAGSAYPYLVLIGALCWLVHVRRFKMNVMDRVKTEQFAEDRELKPEKIVLGLKTFGFYLTHSLIPFKTTFYHSFLQSCAGALTHKAYSMKDRFFWAGLVGFIGMVAYMVSHPWNMVSFGLLWFMITLAPFCNVIRAQQEIAERYTYLPNVGLMFVLATLLVNHPMLAAGWVSMYATKMWFWMDSYADDFYLSEFSSLVSPDAWYSWHVKAIKRWWAASYQEAVIYWTMARRISPNEFKINYNLATALRLSANPEHWKEAEHMMKIAENCAARGQEDQVKDLCDKWRKGNYSIIQ